jgi:predicted acylesterase/phospholipase RssA
LPSRALYTAAHTPKGGQPSVGVGFSAGGLLFPYYVGVSEALRSAGVLTDATHVAGASAGSLIAAAIVARVPTPVLLDALHELSAELRLSGTRGRLRAAVEHTLDKILPPDAHLQLSGRLHVAVTRLDGVRPTPLLLSEFHSSEDLRDALLASCHIPWYMNNRFATRYRDRWCLDGGVTDFLPVPPDCDRPVRVCCFPAYSAAARLSLPQRLSASEAASCLAVAASARKHSQRKE